MWVPGTLILTSSAISKPNKQFDAVGNVDFSGLRIVRIGTEESSASSITCVRRLIAVSTSSDLLRLLTSCEDRSRFAFIWFLKLT